MAAEDTPEIERDGSAPPQQADEIPQYVSFVGLISDEFGVAASVARRDLLMGTVTLDGEPLDHVKASKLHALREDVKGKTLEVVGGDTGRTYRLQIAE